MTSGAEQNHSALESSFSSRTKLGSRVALLATLALGFGLRERQLSRDAPAHHSAGFTSQASLLPTAHAPVISRLERAPAAPGGETLQGKARFDWAARGSVQVEETAELTAAGRLLRAEVSLSYSGATLPSVLDCGLAERLTLDAVAGVVSVERLNGRRDSRRVSADFPWIYLPVRLPDGAWLATPSAVTVAERAARAGGALRLVKDCGPDESVMSDQVAVPGSAEDWLLLGNDLATFRHDASGQSQLVSLRVARLGLELLPTEGAKGEH